MYRVAEKWKQTRKKGMTTLEIVIGMLICIMMLCGLMDVTNILQKTTALSSVNAYVSRVVADQGGVDTKEINNFAGDYITSAQVYSNVKKIMNNSGVEDEDWGVYIGQVRLSPATKTGPVEYGSTVNVRVVVNYKWDLTSNYVPGNLNNNMSSSSRVFTTHKIRNASFNQDTVVGP